MNSVVAIAIDKNNIYVPCKKMPNCCNRRGFNIHGNAKGTLENRSSGRSSHCSCNYNNIIVDDTTVRATLVKRTKLKCMFVPTLFEKRN